MTSQCPIVSEQPGLQPLLQHAARAPAATARPSPWVFGMPASSGSSQWMAKFCVEPPDDVATCCLGWFVPCALYGKTHWRLEQLRKKKDPLDTSWKPSFGCNGPCWLFYGLSVCIGPLGSCIVTGFARNRIRATYDIDGSCGLDFVAAFFCTECVLMQNDRELRARNFELQCRTNTGYGTQAHSPICAQPSPEVRMVYSQNLEITERYSEQKKSNVLKKATKPAKGLGYVFFPPRDIELNTLSPCAIEIAPPKTINPRRDSQMSRSLPHYHRSITVGDVSPRSQIEEPAPAAQSHIFNERLESVKRSVKGSVKGSVNGGAKVPEGRSSSVRSMDSCITLVVGCPDTGNSPRHLTKAQKAAQLSYFHDFTDCPVDKKVLDYIEQAEKESQSKADAQKNEPQKPTATEDFYIFPALAPSPCGSGVIAGKTSSAKKPLTVSTSIQDISTPKFVESSAVAPAPAPETKAASAQPAQPVQPAQQAQPAQPAQPAQSVSASKNPNQKSSVRVPLSQVSPRSSSPVQEKMLQSVNRSSIHKFSQYTVDKAPGSGETTPKASNIPRGSVVAHTIKDCPDEKSDTAKQESPTEHYLSDCERIPGSWGSEPTTPIEHKLNDCENVSEEKNSESGQTYATSQEHVSGDSDESSSVDEKSQRSSDVEEEPKKLETNENEKKPALHDDSPVFTRQHTVKECTGVDGPSSPVSTPIRERNNLSEVLTQAFKIPDKQEMEEAEKSRAVIAKTNALREFLARAKAHSITYDESMDECPETSQLDTHPQTAVHSPPAKPLVVHSPAPRRRDVSPVPRGLDLNAITKARSQRGTQIQRAGEHIKVESGLSPRPGHRRYEHR